MSVETKLKNQIGELVFQNIVLVQNVEDLQKEVTELKKEKEPKNTEKQ